MARQSVRGGRALVMRPLIEEWRRGSASQAEVARRHGLNPGTFAWWCAQLGGRKGRAATPRLVAVDVVDRGRVATQAEAFEVVLAAGLRVRVPAGFEAGDLRRLLEVVRGC